MFWKDGLEAVVNQFDLANDKPEFWHFVAWFTNHGPLF